MVPGAYIMTTTKLCFHNDVLALGQLKVTALPDLPLESMWRVVWPKGKKHNGAAMAFKNYLTEQLPQIIEKNFGYIDGLTAVPKSMM